MKQEGQRAHARLSPSSATRWIACTPSVGFSEYLLGKGLISPDNSTDATREGTIAHAVAEEVLSRRSLGDYNTDHLGVDGATQEMIEHAEAYSDYIQEAIALIDPDGDVELHIEERVDISNYIPEAFGTADCYLLGRGVLHVIDYKFGKGVAVSATENAQMRCYAIGVLDLVELTTTDEIHTVKTTIYQPRLGRYSTEVLTRSQLVEWAKKTLKPRAALAHRGIGEYYPGSHCRFCPGLPYCRAFASQALQLERLDALEGNELKSPEMAVLIRHLDDLSGYISKLKDRATSEILAGGSVPGLKVVAGRSTRYIIDEEEAERRLTEAGVPEEMIYIRRMAGITDLQKTVGKKRFEELLSGLIDKKEGKPTLVMEDDPRQQLTPRDYFEGII